MLYLSSNIPSTIFYESIFSEVLLIARCSLNKITSHRRLEDVPKRRPDVLRTSPYDPICNAIRSGASLGRSQDINLIIIDKMVFYGIFYFSQVPLVYQTLYCQSKLELLAVCILRINDFIPTAFNLFSDCFYVF